ncbi:TldD/PmbA family protein [Leptolyngbya sp. BC1307]|uniref:TldD/PmbA family protein n=1 Tax=Leptolyngbya sp. BC1307 TaxID=2029589 RepID=UPI000EFC6B0D|nr:TldD/PmbA family protein [Leptolyngbya sp. BC1307]
MEDLAERLLAGAIAAGAEAAEVFQSSSLARPVIFEGNRLKQAETSQAEGVALRLWRDGQPGLAVGYGPIDSQTLVQKALAISTLNAPETPNLTAGEAKDFGAVGTAVETQQLVDWGREAIAQIRDRFPDVICEAELSCDLEETRLINSTGLDYRAQDTALSGYISAELTRPDDFLSAGDGRVHRHALDMSAIAGSIIQRLGWANRTVAPVTGQVPVIFTPGAAWLLWDTLRAALNAKRVAEGTSPWSQRQGDRVIAEAISLRQDPTAGPYSCPFDDEGVLTQPLMFVKAGVLENWYGDLAHKTTGNGIRPSLGSYPTPGLINLLVAPGHLDWQSLVAAQQEAVIVDQVLGEGGDITGDLSISLELGYRVTQGEIVGRVKDTMVSGNAYSALNHLIGLGSEAEWSGSTYTPAVVVDGLSVTG